MIAPGGRLRGNRRGVGPRPELPGYGVPRVRPRRTRSHESGPIRSSDALGAARCDRPTAGAPGTPSKGRPCAAGSTAMPHHTPVSIPSPAACPRAPSERVGRHDAHGRPVPETRGPCRCHGPDDGAACEIPRIREGRLDAAHGHAPLPLEGQDPTPLLGAMAALVRIGAGSVPMGRAAPPPPARPGRDRRPSAAARPAPVGSDDGGAAAPADHPHGAPGRGPCPRMPPGATASCSCPSPGRGGTPSPGA